MIQPLVFTGISQYSSDFQQILNRAVQLASIPLQQLQNQQSDLQQQTTLAQSLSGAVGDLASSVSDLGDIGDSRALVASSSDSSVASATVTGAATGASFVIDNVTSVARAASESSLTSYADAAATPVSATGSVRLTVGSQNYDLTLAPGQNNLSGLRDAINAANAGVTAAIFTTSTGAYLNVSANNLGATTLTLKDDPTGANTDLLTATNQGANSIFDLNGVPVSEPSTQINNVVPGVTFTISGKSAAGESANISLTPDRSRLESALQTLAVRYNAAANQVNAQIGPNAGLLTGNSIVRQARAAMANLVNFRSNSAGSISGIADLGISLSQSGQMSFDSSKLEALSDSQLGDAFTFLSANASGLGAEKGALQQLSDPISGAIQAAVQQFQTAGQRISSQVADMTARITLMQTTLQAQLQAADASIAELQSQQSLLTANINSLDYTTYGKNVVGS